MYGESLGGNGGIVKVNSKEIETRVNQCEKQKKVNNAAPLEGREACNLSLNNNSQQFFQLAKKLAVDGALISETNQMPIEDRSAKRHRLCELKKQKNIENIIKKTALYCADFDINEKLDFDWLTRFISLSEEIGNVSMQELWAKILARELSEPGSFSFKTLQVFRDMSIHDAKLLAKACSLAIKEQNSKSIRLLTGVYQSPGLFNFLSKNRRQYCNLSHFGLSHADLLSLSESHLIYAQESESNLLARGENIHFEYNGKPLKLKVRKHNVCMQFYRLTPIGVELSHLIHDKGNEEFRHYLQQLLSRRFVVNYN